MYKEYLSLVLSLPQGKYCCNQWLLLTLIVSNNYNIPHRQDICQAQCHHPQGCCKVGNHLAESGIAKGRKPFDWRSGGCAPDLLSPFPAAEGGKKQPCNQWG